MALLIVSTVIHKKYKCVHLICVLKLSKILLHPSRDYLWTPFENPDDPSISLGSVYCLSFPTLIYPADICFICLLVRKAPLFNLPRKELWNYMGIFLQTYRARYAWEKNKFTLGVRNIKILQAIFEFSQSFLLPKFSGLLYIILPVGIVERSDWVLYPCKIEKGWKTFLKGSDGKYFRLWESQEAKLRIL